MNQPFLRSDYNRVEKTADYSGKNYYRVHFPTAVKPRPVKTAG
jgi:hypothetical protein